MQGRQYATAAEGQELDCKLLLHLGITLTGIWVYECQVHWTSC